MTEWRLRFSDGREERIEAPTLAAAMLALGYGTDDFRHLVTWESHQRGDDDVDQ